MKKRLDELLVERELVETLGMAQARVMAGDVYVNGQRCDKAGTRLSEHATLVLRGDPMPFVSRGGLKLDAALEAFGYDCTAKIVLDVGASTGGFTDCVLQRGATRVYAVDVGYGQLAWSLRQDERVVNIERANIRTLPREAISEACDLAVIDCSFISLLKVLPPTLPFLAPECDVVALIKPQFEVASFELEAGGVVRDDVARQRVIDAVVEGASSLGLCRVQSVDASVHGPAGNVEHLIWLRR